MNPKMRDETPSGAALARQCVVSVAQAYSGPLPPPDLLAGFEHSCPGAADRIIRMAEQEAGHRRAMEAIIVNAGAAEIEKQFDESKRGQVFAAFITISAIVAGTYLAMNGHEFSGGVIGIGGVGGIVTTFILGRAGSNPLPEPATPRPKSTPTS